MAKKTNFEVNGKQYYRVTRTIGHKPDGTPIKKQFYGTGINEANKKADEYMDKIQSGLLNDFDKIPLEIILGMATLIACILIILMSAISEHLLFS